MRIHLILLISLFLAYTVNGTCLLLLKKKKLAVVAGGALLGKKLVPKLLLGGAGILIGKKLLKKKACCKRPCGCGTGCGKCLFRRRRAIGDIVSDLSSRAFENVSTRLENTGKNIRTFGDQVHRVSDTVRNASFSTRIAGVFASDRIRRTAVNLLGSSTASETNLVRERRAAPRRSNIPRNFQLPTGKLSLEEMLQFVRQHNAQVCLQRVICELSANSNMYGQDGIRFGSKLLNYQNVSSREAQMYKSAAAYGNKNRGRPQQCSKKYPQSQCGYDSAQLISVGNSILY